MQLDVHFQLIELDARVGWRLRAWLAISPACCMGSAASTGSAVLQIFFRRWTRCHSFILLSFTYGLGIATSTAVCTSTIAGIGHCNATETAPLPPAWHMRRAVARSMCLILSTSSPLCVVEPRYSLYIGSAGAARQRHGYGYDRLTLQVGASQDPGPGHYSPSGIQVHSYSNNAP
jgi:hypothetical protein